MAQEDSAEIATHHTIQIAKHTELHAGKHVKNLKYIKKIRRKMMEIQEISREIWKIQREKQQKTENIAEHAIKSAIRAYIL